MGQNFLSHMYLIKIQKVKMMINYLSLFSGIGAFESAMRNLNIPFNLVGFSEIDKYAVKSYCAIHNVLESLNLGDITKIDETKLPKVDFITYGFPCQDISLAGKQQGLFNDDGTKTRSGLFFDALRIIEHTKPMVAIAENVKNLTSKKFSEQFEIVLKSLEDAEYNNYFKVLNAKDFGIPQNRERVFIISIRKDVDTGIFEFPEGYPLKLRLKDMLEDEVDEKFYLSEKMFNYAFNIIKQAEGIGFSDGVDRSFVNPEIAQTIGCRSASCQRSGTTNYVSNEFENPLRVSEMKEIISDTDKVMQIGNCRPTKTRANPNQGRVYDTDGISPCLNQMGGGNREPHIVKVCNINSSQDGIVVDPNGICPTHTAGHGNTPKILIHKATMKDLPLAFDEQNGYVRTDGTVGTVMTDGSSPKHNNRVIESGDVVSRLRIRKLTPKECFRLMGFKDEEFTKAEVVNSNTQLYKQAGNSIVVDVAEELLCMLFDEDGMLFI